MIENFTNIAHKRYYDTVPYHCQYGIVFDDANTFTYSDKMRGMREILKELMASAGENAYALSDRSGVPQPTIQRFLSGLHGDPRSTTVRKLAKAYGLTESQLRGGEHIQGIETGSVAPTITREQQQVLSMMGALDKDARDALLKLGNLLSRRPRERRRTNIGHSPERRSYGDPDYIRSVYESAENAEKSKKRKEK